MRAYDQLSLRTYPGGSIRPGSGSLPGVSVPPATGLIAVVGAYHCREVVAQPITPNDYPRLVSLVRTLAPDTRSARALGDGLQWEHDSGYSSFSLTINPEPTGTVIRGDLRTDGEQVVHGLGAFGTGLLSAIGATAAISHLGASWRQAYPRSRPVHGSPAVSGVPRAVGREPACSIW
jgi:hypothetical protein